jgi:hypothetical protein
MYIVVPARQRVERLSEREGGELLLLWGRDPNKTTANIIGPLPIYSLDGYGPGTEAAPPPPHHHHANFPNLTCLMTTSLLFTHLLGYFLHEVFFLTPVTFTTEEISENLSTVDIFNIFLCILNVQKRFYYLPFPALLAIKKTLVCRKMQYSYIVKCSGRGEIKTYFSPK